MIVAGSGEGFGIYLANCTSAAVVANAEATGTGENQRNFKDLTRESPQLRAVFDLSPFLLVLLCPLKSKELTKNPNTVWPPLFNGRARAES